MTLDVERGLAEQEAKARLAAEGPNDLPTPERRSAFRIVFEVLREPMFALLVGAAVLYALIGDRSEAALLVVFATISVYISFFQQRRSERVLEALRDLTSPRALVVRDGVRRRIAGREVVRGDTIVVAEGDRIPADAVLVSGEHLLLDESLLTGESVPVAKRARREDARELPAPGGDDHPWLYSGTLVVRGSGLAIVVTTGVRTHIGAIGRDVASVSLETPRLQQQTRHIVVTFAALGVVLSSIVAVLYALARDSWLDGLLAGIAIVMSLLPEEFPLVLTVFMVMGAWRLSRSRVLTRRPSAIETLGSATVLCTDKTGTLTRNLMAVTRLVAADANWDATEGPTRLADSPSLRALIETAVLSSDRDGNEPMEKSIIGLAAALTPTDDYTFVHEYPLRADLLAVTRVWHPRTDGAPIVAAKGAPEAIAELCKLDSASRATLHETVNRLAADGLRVLAVARGTYAGAALPDHAAELGLGYLGLVGFADPLRESAADAVRECRSAGIRVVMITGDYPATALAIAREAGIDAGEVLTASELNSLPDDVLATALRRVSVFARISPQQKLRIVRALKANGEVVAMTGDGVNDAPALKAADIGIAMGGRGTDVAREASSMVLLDDDFGSIVRAVRGGRRIYDNLRKALGYILAIHVPIAGIAVLPVLMGWPLILTPMLIALLELIIDPACSIVFEAEPEESDVMRRPPRRTDSPLLSAPIVRWALLQGGCALAWVGGLAVFVMQSSPTEAELRSWVFVGLVSANVALIFLNRTFGSSLRSALGRRNPALWIGLAIALGALTLLLWWPPARQFFGLGSLPPAALLAAILGSAALLYVLELAKRAWRRQLTD